MFPEKIEFDGKNIEPNPTTRCLTLSISKPMSYEETKKKKEKDFRLSPIQYPEPIKYPANKVYPDETKCKKIRGSQSGILTLSFIKKTIFCRFWLPFGYPD